MLSIQHQSVRAEEKKATATGLSNKFSNTNPNRLGALPMDLFKIIFDDLTIKEITMVRGVSRFFRNLVDNHKIPIIKAPQIKLDQINLLNENTFPLLRRPGNTTLPYKEFISAIRRCVADTNENNPNLINAVSNERYRGRVDSRRWALVCCVAIACIFCMIAIAVELTTENKWAVRIIGGLGVLSLLPILLYCSSCLTRTECYDHPLLKSCCQISEEEVLHETKDQYAHIQRRFALSTGRHVNNHHTSTSSEHTPLLNREHSPQIV